MRYQDHTIGTLVILALCIGLSTAAVMPPRISARQPAVADGAALPSLWRTPMAAAAAAVGIDAPSAGVEAAQAGRLSWDPVRDFQGGPTGANPSPDRYGNPTVWSYLQTVGWDHDPGNYVPMPTYLHGAAGSEWINPDYQFLMIAYRPDLDVLHLHPWVSGPNAETRSPVLAWTSPVSGAVEIRATVQLEDPACAAGTSGIVFWLDHGAHVVHRYLIPSGGTQDIVETAAVKAGESLYFTVDPGLDSNCDTTYLTMSITGYAAEVPDTALAPAS